MIELIKVAILRDGGSILLLEKEVHDSIKTPEDYEKATKYYIDGRFGSETRGELFINNPKNSDSIKLDISKYKIEK